MAKGRQCREALSIACRLFSGTEIGPMFSCSHERHHPVGASLQSKSEFAADQHEGFQIGCCAPWVSTQPIDFPAIVHGTIGVKRVCLLYHQRTVRYMHCALCTPPKRKPTTYCRMYLPTSLAILTNLNPTISINPSARLLADWSMTTRQACRGQNK